MIKTTIQQFKCEICGRTYDAAGDAQLCESKPITQDKGAKVGDKVLVISGEGKGEKMKVSGRFIFDMNWGHYAASRYHHTVGLVADSPDGSRQLTFDDYETL